MCAGWRELVEVRLEAADWGAGCVSAEGHS